MGAGPPRGDGRLIRGAPAAVGTGDAPDGPRGGNAALAGADDPLEGHDGRQGLVGLRVQHLAGRGGVSRYARRVRIRRGGLYRVFVAIADGNFVSSAGREVKITRVF